MGGWDLHILHQEQVREGIAFRCPESLGVGGICHTRPQMAPFAFQLILLAAAWTREVGDGVAGWRRFQVWRRAGRAVEVLGYPGLGCDAGALRVAPVTDRIEKH